MAFNSRFHHGANKYSIADAMNPFKYLIPANSKDEQHCTISVSRQVIEADVGHKHRPEHQDESDFKFEVSERIVPSQG
jgi:hypothetical protein